MTTIMQFNFLLMFTLIFFYILLRILINTKFNKSEIIKELYLVGLISSVLFVLALTIFPIAGVQSNPTNLNLTPFKMITVILTSGDLLKIVSSILGNILLFVPLGFFAYFCFEGNGRDSLLICLLLTVGVEAIQLLQPFRMTDIDDVFLNLLGGFIGILLSYKFVKKTQLRF